MTNFILKVKINKYFPKIETIPYNNFICLMICNNYFSEIKLSEIKSKIFSYTSKEMNNSDLLLKIKLIDYVENYSLVGVYDLVIPYLNIIKMFNKIYTSYNKQVMLRMSNNYNFNICLDLTIEVSTLEANTSIFIKEINYKTFDYKNSNSNKPMREALKLNYNKKNLKSKIKKFAVPKRNNNENEFYDSSFIRNNSNYNNVMVNNYLNIFRTENKTGKYINYNIKNRSPNNLFSKFKNVINFDNNHKRKITDFNLYDKLNKNNNNNNNILMSSLFAKSSENFYSSSKQKKDLNDKSNNIGRKWINKSPDESNILNTKSNYEKSKNFKNNTLEIKDISEFSYLYPYYERNTLNNTNRKNYIYNKKYFTKNSKETIKSSIPINTINNYSDKRNNYIFNKRHIYSKKYLDNTFSTKSKKLKHPKEISSVLNHFNHIKSRIRHIIEEKANLANISQKIHHKKDDLKKYVDNYMRSQNQTETSSEMKNALNDGSEVLNFIQSESGVNDFNNNEIISDLNQSDIKDKIVKQIDDICSLKKEIEQKIKDNKNLIPKYFLYKEKYNAELKSNNCLKDEKNIKEIKSIIHVNINSKLNEQFYLRMKGIKNKEMEVIENIFRDNKKNMLKKSMKKKLEQQKEIHALLKIIRELVKNYENLSQLYNNEHKKILFKSLLVRYGIREKEEKKDFNFIDKYNELKRNVDNEKNKIKKSEVEKDIYKNIINEEDSEESRSSISGKKSKNNILKKLSWCSEDSVIKERLDFEDIQEKENIISSNIISNPDSKRKELLIEDYKVQNDNIINDKPNS